MRASEIKVPRKLKPRNLISDLSKNLSVCLESSIHTSMMVQISVQRMSFNIAHHLTHLAEFSSFNTSSVQSSNLPLKYILQKAQICLQLGIRPKFRNKWSRETALIRLRLSVLKDLKSLHATWLVSLNMHLAGSVGKRNIAKGWTKAGIPELFQGKTTLSPEDSFENIAAIII